MGPRLRSPPLKISPSQRPVKDVDYAAVAFRGQTPRAASPQLWSPLQSPPPSAATLPAASPWPLVKIKNPTGTNERLVIVEGSRGGREAQNLTRLRGKKLRRRRRRMKSGGVFRISRGSKDRRAYRGGKSIQGSRKRRRRGDGLLRDGSGALPLPFSPSSGRAGPAEDLCQSGMSNSLPPGAEAALTCKVSDQRHGGRC